MDETSEVRSTLLAVLRRWPMIVALMLVGAVAMAGIAMREKGATSYSSTSKVNVGASGVSNMATPAGTVAYAISPLARAAVEASQGLDPARVVITAAVDQKDPQTVKISVSAPTADGAQAWATALAEQCREFDLAKYGWMIQMEESKSARLTQRIATLTKQASEFRRLAAAATDPTTRMQYMLSAQSVTVSVMNYEDQLDMSKYTRQGYLSWITAFPGSTATKVSGGGIAISTLSRGALVGLFIGAVIAVILENRRKARHSSDR